MGDLKDKESDTARDRKIEVWAAWGRIQGYEIEDALGVRKREISFEKDMPVFPLQAGLDEASLSRVAPWEGWPFIVINLPLASSDGHMRFFVAFGSSE